MKHAQRRLHDYLADILQAQARIEEYIRPLDVGDFLMSHLVQDAVVRNFEIIGEASKHILQRFPDFVAAHPELPLAVAYRLRNIVAHGYHEVDYQVVWDTIRQDLPDLCKQVKACLDELDADGLAP